MPGLLAEQHCHPPVPAAAEYQASQRGILQLTPQGFADAEVSRGCALLRSLARHCPLDFMILQGHS